MKVAFLNRPPAPNGGDQVALRATIDALNRAGVEAKHVWCNLAMELPAYDLAHVFHMDFHWCQQNYGALIRANMPYVMTPVFYPELDGMPAPRKLEAIRAARAVFPFSRAEQSELEARFGRANYVPVPNGTDPRFHDCTTHGRRWGVCACDWGGTKHTDVIEAACALAGLQFEVFRHIPYDLMPMAYRRYRVFASASRSDRMSLAVGEALCSGCRVISSTANRGNEWYYGLATVSPDSAIVEWAKWLRAAHECATWDDRPNMAARAITWDVVAERLKVEYERALV